MFTGIVANLLIVNLVIMVVYNGTEFCDRQVEDVVRNIIPRKAMRLEFKQ